MAIPTRTAERLAAVAAAFAMASEFADVKMGNAKPGRLRRPSKPMYKAGRNDPCPCGSGLKFKKCCVNKVTTNGEAVSK